MKESVTYQAILEEGRVEGEQSVLLRLGTKRFGKPDAATIRAIRAITSIESLEQLSERSLEVESWAELLR